MEYKTPDIVKEKRNIRWPVFIVYIRKKPRNAIDDSNYTGSVKHRFYDTNLVNAAASHYHEPSAATVGFWKAEKFQKVFN